MAKNIMISNKIYEDLKRIKGRDKSFSDVIAEALDRRKPKEKTIAALAEFAGILKDYPEDKAATEWLKKAQKMTDDEIWRKSR